MAQYWSEACKSFAQNSVQGRFTSIEDGLILMFAYLIWLSNMNLSSFRHFSFINLEIRDIYLLFLQMHWALYFL